MASREPWSCRTPEIGRNQRMWETAPFLMHDDNASSPVSPTLRILSTADSLPRPRPRRSRLVRPLIVGLLVISCAAMYGGGTADVVAARWRASLDRVGDRTAPYTRIAVEDFVRTAPNRTTPTPLEPLPSHTVTAILDDDSAEAAGAARPGSEAAVATQLSIEPTPVARPSGGSPERQSGEGGRRIVPVVRNGSLDTEPPLLSHALPPLEGRPRYLSYIPHSGFHNQRISLMNALTLAALLNRTLLVPPCRLGWAQPWQETDTLQDRVERFQRYRLRSRCGPHRHELEAKERLTTDINACQYWTRYSEVSWSLLFDLERMDPPIRLVQRSDLRRSWLFSNRGLGIDRTKVHRFPDTNRMQSRFHDSREQTMALGPWHERIDIEDLKTGKFAEYELLEFSSLFGDPRIIATLDSTRRALAGAAAATTLDLPLVDGIADEIESQLGGRGAYDSAHLRLGDSLHSQSNIDAIFRRICADRGLNATFTEQLLTGARSRTLTARDVAVAAAGPSGDGAELGDDELPDVYVADEADAVVPRRRHRRAQAQADRLACRAPLHTDPELLGLNRRIYVATDAQHPLRHPVLAPFVRTFPCLFILYDFMPTTPSLRKLDKVRSASEHIKLRPFLTPLLEVVMAARGENVYGTPGSTFSQYAAGTLHAHYHPNATAASL